MKTPLNPGLNPNLWEMYYMHLMTVVHNADVPDSQEKVQKLSFGLIE